MSDQHLTAAELIATLQNEVDRLKQRLDQTEKWGKAGWKRWDILRDALKESEKVEQDL